MEPLEVLCVTSYITDNTDKLCSAFYHPVPVHLQDCKLRWRHLSPHKECNHVALPGHFVIWNCCFCFSCTILFQNYGLWIKWKKIASRTRPAMFGKKQGIIILTVEQNDVFWEKQHGARQGHFHHLKPRSYCKTYILYTWYKSFSWWSLLGFLQLHSTNQLGLYFKKILTEI